MCLKKRWVIRDVYIGPHLKFERCPRGKTKADEGFADVEAARLVYRILRKASYLHATGQEEMSAEKWFFFVLQLKNCVVGERFKKSTLHDPHPRNSIRGNAIAQQMWEFTEAFQCSSGDRNHVVNQPCAVYVLPRSEHESDHADLPQAAALIQLQEPNGVAIRPVSFVVALCAIVSYLVLV
uniref:Peptidase_M13 domain-containing protein n=1 Tax=Steinernema glaseri TaxID=37863 RepID=A0A1I7Y331_9BILA